MKPNGQVWGKQWGGEKQQNMEHQSRNQADGTIQRKVKQGVNIINEEREGIVEREHEGEEAKQKTNGRALDE